MWTLEAWSFFKRRPLKFCFKNMSKVRNVVTFTLFIRILTLLEGTTFQALSMFLRCVQIQLPWSRSSAAEVPRSKHHGCHNYHDYHHDNKHEHNDDFWLSSWTFKFFQHMVGSPKHEFKHETVSEENLAVAPTLEIFMLAHENSTLNLYTLPETNIFRRKHFMTPSILFSRVFVIVLWRALQRNLVLVCVFEDLNTMLPW